MTLIRFDSVGGASGDMILAALAGLGVDLDDLRAALATLALEPFEIRTEAASSHGLHGTRVHVTVHHAEHHPHRRLADIQRLIEGARLPDRVRAMSLRVFRRLAEAEATVHGTTPEDIHFHEVGAVDSIVDIVGSCYALDRLGTGAVAVGPLPDGQGTTRFSHGVMPIPVPAVVELMKGHTLVPTDEPFEMLTPTGAALLTTWAAALPLAPDLAGAATVRAVSNGFGHRALQHRPNLLRAVRLETGAAADATHDTCHVLECNLDDTTPELIGSLAQALLARGALDVFTTAVQMKKQRPGTLLTVLCHADQRDALLDALFTGSTTFGVREHAAQRTVLARRHVEVATPYGPVRVKVGTWKDRDVTRAPEHADCVRAAEAHGVPVRAVYEAALAAAIR